LGQLPSFVCIHRLAKDLVSQIEAKQSANVSPQTNLDFNSDVLTGFDLTSPEDTFFIAHLRVSVGC